MGIHQRHGTSSYQVTMIACSAVTTSMFRSQQTAEGRNQPDKNPKVIDELEERGAGEGNRTRMTSLGSCWRTLACQPS
jgi:hypothetical protein